MDPALSRRVAKAVNTLRPERQLRMDIAAQVEHAQSFDDLPPATRALVQHAEALVKDKAKTTTPAAKGA